MSVPARSLKRLATLYGLVEHARALELGVAASAVDEVERAERAEVAVQHRCAQAGVEALQRGDRLEWGLASMERDAAASRTRRLEAMRLEREATRETARERHRASRVESEQMKSAVDREQRELELDSARRAQAAADDQFLSRREWSRVEEAGRVEEPDRLL